MSRFGDFVAIWFGTLFTLNFVVLPVLGTPLGLYTGTAFSVFAGLVLAVVLVFYRDVSLPTVVGAE